MVFKPSNPKDALGIRKVPFSTVPAQVVAEVGLSFLEGALKYGRHNYRSIGVRASVYYDACRRHIDEWWEGGDIDKDSGLSNITKAIACLFVLRDAEINRLLNDDRPPALADGWIQEYNTQVENLLKKYEGVDIAHVYTEIDNSSGLRRHDHI